MDEVVLNFKVFVGVKFVVRFMSFVGGLKEFVMMLVLII